MPGALLGWLLAPLPPERVAGAPAARRRRSPPPPAQVFLRFLPVGVVEWQLLPKTRKRAAAPPPPFPNAGSAPTSLPPPSRHPPFGHGRGRGKLTLCLTPQPQP